LRKDLRMNASTFGILAAMTAFSVGCAAEPMAEEGSRTEDAMTAYSAKRSPLANGHYTSEDGTIMLLLTTVGTKQRASLYDIGRVMEADVDVGLVFDDDASIRYRPNGNVGHYCDDHLVKRDYFRGIILSGTCSENARVFADADTQNADVIQGARTSSHDASQSVTVKSATATSITLDLTATGGRLEGLEATWTTAVEARGSAGKCGDIAVVFADKAHATAYWVKAPTDATCPNLPVR
jgi:hypothetical protein